MTDPKQPDDASAVTLDATLKAELMLAALDDSPSAQAIAARHGVTVEAVRKAATSLASRGEAAAQAEVEELKKSVDLLSRRVGKLAQSINLLGAFVHPIGVADLPLLVTGCARSGTHFTTALLQAAGRGAAHEMPSTEATVSWIHAPPAARAKYGLRFQRILHQHREPLATIGSCLTLSERSWSYVAEYASECADGDPIARAAKYWVVWNELAEVGSHLSYSVSSFDSPAFLQRFSAVSGIRITLEAVAAAKEKRDSRTAHPSYQTLTWDDLRSALSDAWFQRVHSAAQRYQYVSAE